MTTKGEVRTITDDHKGQRLARTIASLLGWICMGLFSEVSGPTLPYLRQRVDVNYEEISRSLVARSVGFLLGSLAGGVLCQRLFKLSDIWIALALICAGIATAVAPWCPNLLLLSIMFFIDGCGKGILAAATSALILILWKKKASVPTHALHFCFGVGALISPQLVRPFLPSDDVMSACGDTSNVTSTEAPETNFTTTPSCGVEEHIEYPYLMIGILCVGTGIAFVLFYIFMKSPTETSVAEDEDEEEDKSAQARAERRQDHKYLNILFMIFLVLFCGLPAGVERSYGKFIYPIATESDLAFTVSEGTLLVLLFWLCFTLSRGAATLCANWVSQSILLLVELILATASIIVLVIFITSSSTLLWIMTCTFAAGLSPLFPAAVAWSTKYVQLPPLVTAFLFISSALGAILFSWLSGYLFQYHGTRSIMILLLSNLLAACIFFIALVIIGRRKERLMAQIPATDECLHMEPYEKTVV